MKRSERIVKANQENLMMLYVRPKKPEDINVGDPKYFSHFLFHLFKNKVNNKHTSLYIYKKFVFLFLEQICLQFTRRVVYWLGTPGHRSWIFNFYSG